MKPIALALLCTMAAMADSTQAPIPPPISPAESSPVGSSIPSNCDDYLDRAKRYECHRAKRTGVSTQSIEVQAELQPAKWDTVTTISISSTGDTSRAMTIKRHEDWEGLKRDVNRATGLYMVLGVVQLLGTALLILVAVAS
jgi:hypothetical protein